MKIKKVYIKNFRSIRELEFTFPESGLMVLVGANNAGKSNIVRAINNILGESWWGKDVDLMDFYKRDRNNTIEIKIEFDNDRQVEYSSNDDVWAKYYDENGNQIWSSQGNIKEDFPCSYLPAQRSISQTLSFSKWSLMGKIAQSFNKKVKNYNLEEDLKDKFQEIMNILDDIQEFKQFKEDFVSFFEELQLSEASYSLKVNFKPFSPVNYFKTINILANDQVLGEDFDIDIEELGEGTRNLIILSLLRSYAKNFKQEAQGLIIIEEPEIYMHPQARRHLLTVLKDIVKDSNIQIIITTHSSSFIETEYFDNIGLVYKTPDEGTKIRQVIKEDLSDFANQTGAHGSSRPENITEFYAITSNDRLKEGFFSKFIVLVEGETEELCFPLLFEMAGIDVNKLGISIIRVGGKTQLPKYWRLFFKFQIPMLVVFDNDLDKSKGDRNNEQIAQCFNISVEDIENLEENQTFKIIEAESESPSFIQPLLVFKKNIEFAIKTEFSRAGYENKYNEYETEAENLKLRKPQKLRYILRRLSKDEDFNYVPEFISESKQIIAQNFNFTIEATNTYDENDTDEELPF